MSAINFRIRTPENEWSVAFQQPTITIGRGDEDTLDLQIADAMVSRQHGEIWLTADGYWYKDNNSTSGSKKNGSLIMGPVRVFTGDIISVGESTLTVSQADISDDELDLNELFDVQVQDRLNLHDDSISPRKPSAKVKIIAQRAWAKTNPEPASEFTPNFFGELVNIFEYGDQLNDCLGLAIEEIVRLFNPVERGTILMLDNTGRELNVVAHYPLFEPAISTSLVRKTIEEKKAFIWKADQSSFSSSSIKKLRIKMGLYSPLAFGPNQLGVICADTTSSTADIGKDDLELFMNITQVLSALIYARQLEGTQPQ
jgi:hypothetical protein